MQFNLTALKADERKSRFTGKKAILQAKKAAKK